MSSKIRSFYPLKIGVAIGDNSPTIAYNLRPQATKKSFVCIVPQLKF
jgi:hypothetical protein